MSAGEMQATVSRDARGRFMPGVSGNPLGQIKGKRLTALYTELASDFGGEDQLTAAGRLLLEQACRLKLRAEREHNPNHAVRLSNASARLLAKVATERRPESPPPSLETYRRAKHEALP